MRIIAQKIYGADDIELEPEAQKKIERYKKQVSWKNSLPQTFSLKENVYFEHNCKNVLLNTILMATPSPAVHQGSSFMQRRKSILVLLFFRRFF